MAKDYCVMPECSNNPGKVGRFGKPVKLYRLPTKKSLRRQWLIAISRKKFKHSSYTRVCSDHFDHGVGPSKHSPDKIPTKFLAQRSTSKVTHNSMRKSPTKTLEQRQTVNVSLKEETITTCMDAVEVEALVSTLHSYSLNSTKERTWQSNETLQEKVKN